MYQEDCGERSTPSANWAVLLDHKSLVLMLVIMVYVFLMKTSVYMHRKLVNGTPSCSSTHPRTTHVISPCFERTCVNTV